MPEVDEPFRLRFRETLAHVSSAVSIVATTGPDGPVGLTVSALCSVTDSPPTVLFCINQASYTHRLFKDGAPVSINVLAAEHEALAMTFAGAGGTAMADRFATAEWVRSQKGLPRLVSAVATMSGSISGHTIRGSHSVIYAELEDVGPRHGIDGLVYFQRKFHRIASGPVDQSPSKATRE